MKFCEVISALARGAVVKRASWPRGLRWWAHLSLSNNGKLLRDDEVYTFTEDDFLADDWQIVTNYTRTD